MTEIPIPHDRLSVPAIVTYALLGMFAATIVGLFILVSLKVSIEPVMLGLLGGVIGTLGTNLAAAVGFHVGATAGGNRAQDKLGQLAGAGQPPPADPTP